MAKVGQSSVAERTVSENRPEHPGIEWCSSLEERAIRQSHQYQKTSDNGQRGGSSGQEPPLKLRTDRLDKIGKSSAHGEGTYHDSQPPSET